MDESLKVRMNAVETKTSMLENVLAQFISSTNQMVIRLEADTKKFKDEMGDFKDEMRYFKDETRRSNKEMNKRWGELSNKMG
ncbi:MAG: hypothetical protein GY859_06315, partial [Desulfobacterales bacterium]|nr:hypothetical protein [Desulfobacterales bacterium]